MIEPTITTTFSQITLPDWLKITAIFLASIGLFLNAWQQWKVYRQKRIEYVSDVLWKIYDDEELSEIYYKIEYSEFIYNSNDFHGSENEKKLDKLLSTFDILAKQYYLKLITIQDIDLISYEYLVIFQNKEINKYFDFLDSWFDKRGIKNPPFDKLRKLGKIVENNHSTN